MLVCHLVRFCYRTSAFIMFTLTTRALFMVGIVVMICPDMISSTRPLGRYSIFVWNSCLLRVRVRHLQRIRRVLFTMSFPGTPCSVLTTVLAGSVCLVVIIVLQRGGIIEWAVLPLLLMRRLLRRLSLIIQLMIILRPYRRFIVRSPRLIGVTRFRGVCLYFVSALCVAVYGHSHYCDLARRDLYNKTAQET